MKRFSRLAGWRGKVLKILWVNGFVLVLAALLAFGENLRSILYLPQLEKEIATALYITNFDQSSYARADFGNPLYHASEGTPYDQKRIEQAAERVSLLDRPKVLKAIFERVTAEARTDTEQHLAILHFLQDLTIHTATPPMYPDGVLVCEPLILLELNEMWCGQGAKLAVDLFQSAGYPARIVQLASHQIAEVHYEGGWHYLDTDIFVNGQCVILPGKGIPSVNEMCENEQNMQRLDALASFQEDVIRGICMHGTPEGGEEVGGARYPSYYYCSSSAYSSDTSGYHYKNSSQEESEADTHNYGWERTRWEEDPARRLLDFPLQHTPTVPYIQSAEIQGNQLVIRFLAEDQDGDLAGYRVFVSGHSRGWDYCTFYGSESASQYWSLPDGWKPEMYELAFQLPPSELGLFNTWKPEISIPISLGRKYFISIMGFDAYGESVHRQLYPLSNELYINGWDLGKPR